MSYSIVQGDITKIKADIIVNASNGIGYMGGFTGRFIRLKGVAESIHYETKGVVEKEAKKACKTSTKLPRHVCGRKAGDIFVTSAGSLDALYIIHAVTMKFPGMRAKLNTIDLLLPKIIEKAYALKAKSLVIPLLGAGTGHINSQKVLDKYKEYFEKITDLEIIICLRKLN